MKAKWIILMIAMICALSLGPAWSCGDDDDDDTDDDDDNDDNDSVGDDDTSDDDDDSGHDPLDEVDPFIGTGGLPMWNVGAMIPGALAPNGMVKLSPDTIDPDRDIPWLFEQIIELNLHAGGYWYADDTIRGISHTHLPGTGITDQGNFSFMPVVGISDDRILKDGYRSEFSHDNEWSRPGYYRVHLDRFDVDVELTATTNVGLHRYTFPLTGQNPYVVIDVSYSLNRPEAALAGNVTVDAPAGELFGYAEHSGGFSHYYGGMSTYFVARFSRPIKDFGTFSDQTRSPGSTFAEGPQIGAYVGFASDEPVVEAKVGISLISVEQARANLDAQVPGWKFDAVQDDTEKAWRNLLGDIEVTGGTPRQRRIFYTAMYHLYAMPTNLTEEGGSYMGFDREVHSADDFTYHSDLSLWDTFRTFHPLLAIIRPDLNRDFIVSMIRMYEQGGSFPMWAHGIGETEVMIGTHSDTVIADTYLKGMTDFDVETAYAGLLEHAMGPVSPAGREGIDDWMDLGYIPFDRHTQSVSLTLEYALNDYCLGQLAEALGKTADADLLAKRAQNYRNLWDPKTRYFRPRMADGRFVEPFWPGNPIINLNGYTESNARHYRWFVTHDVPDLVTSFGGPDPFVAELNEFMEKGMRETDNIFRPEPYYWHGNEPDLHAAYLFALAGRSDLTAHWVHWIMENRYSDDPEGLDGNDDGGTLSAWYIFSALGFYPLPCTDRYVVGSPIFDKAVMRVGENQLVVTATDVSEENRIVQSVKINGEPLDDPWFSHDAIANGGTLEFLMGPELPVGVE
jgi:predicted alpha-1,2-mannosidase